jgi:hypothetical protein
VNFSFFELKIRKSKTYTQIYTQMCFYAFVLVPSTVATESDLFLTDLVVNVIRNPHISFTVVNVSVRTNVKFSHSERTSKQMAAGR